MFRALTDTEAESAYDIYLSAFAWLRARQIRQWLVPTQRDTYFAYVINREVFGLFDSAVLLAVGRLCYEQNLHWKDITGEQNHWWLSSLVVRRNSTYPEKGRSFVFAGLSYLKRRSCDGLYLDCVNNNEFLPAYYQSCGFERLSQKAITYKSGNTFPMVLMRAPVPNPALHPTAQAELLVPSALRASAAAEGER
jgi:hypothetical protein